MKTLLLLVSSLTFTTFQLATYAQLPVVSPTTTTPNPAKMAAKTADHRASVYKGPKVVKSTKALGSKMLRDSKPTNNNPLLRPVAPVKQ